VVKQSALQDTWHEARASRDKAKLRVAVLDLGSTSFHLLVSDASASAGLARVTREREQLRLGAFLNGTARIPEDTCTRAIEAARALKQTSDAYEPDRMLVVATAALRGAENGAELAARIGDAIGTPVRMLSGEQEARLIFSAFRHRLPLDREPLLGADLGGGSLELAIGDDSDVHWETTLRLGVTSLHNELVLSDPMSKRERNAVRARVCDLLAPHLETLAQSQVRRCIASGGTVRALARLLTAMPESLIRWRGEMPVLRIKRRQFGRLTDLLVESTHDERLEMPGIKRNRADLLPTGALILLAMLEACEIKELVACDWGLREGIVLEALGLASAAAR